MQGLLLKKEGDKWVSNPRPPVPQTGALTNWATTSVFLWAANVRGFFLKPERKFKFFLFLRQIARFLHAKERMN